MLTPSDQLRARFPPGDSVQFKYRRRLLEGTLLRSNPKRGVILVNGLEYTVPYELLIQKSDKTNQDEIRIGAVMQQALDLMHEHGLKKWRFRFDQSTRRAGCCNFRTKTISIAFDHARTGTEEDIRDTILHEIAHALVGGKHNHDSVWKAKAKQIGCSGKRTHRLQFLPPRYHVTCENSCWKHTAERRNKRLICRTCGAKLIYTPYAEAM